MRENRVITSQIVNYKDNREDLYKILEFRYYSYVKELRYLTPKAEFDLLKMEFDQYDLCSEHIALINNGEIIACARIIKDSHLGLPALNKLMKTKEDAPLFSKQKNVEVSRLIVKKESRSSFVFIYLIRAVFKSLLTMDCTYVLADTFINSKSYKLLQSLGFKKADLEYNDISFSVNEVSTLLYFNMDEMIEMLKTNPNKGQMTVLKNTGYSFKKLNNEKRNVQL